MTDAQNVRYRDILIAPIEQVIGFDFVQFMNDNQEYFRKKIQFVLEQLMRAG